MLDAIWLVHIEDVHDALRVGIRMNKWLVIFA